MDLRRFWHQFVAESTELLARMRSVEGETLSAVELHILRVQLRLLDTQVQQMQQRLDFQSLVPPSDQQEIKVLFIDPNDNDRHGWATQLANLSPTFVVREAKDGDSGLQLYRSEHIDCIVLELDFPDKSGLSLLLSLVPRSRRPQIAVVILTHLDMESLFPLAISTGAHCCLLKDRITATDLDQTIRKAIASVAANKHGAIQ